MKRLIDICLSLLALVLLSPLFLVIGLAIILESKGGIFFTQERVGKGFQLFNLYKFRSMRPNVEHLGQITVGERDPRITTVGYFLRKYKLDELPQLWNILKGDMSFVGPRPEVSYYVDQYSEEQQQLLSIRPGLTDFASLYYFEEAKLLANSDYPEKTYTEVVMPKKLNYSLMYMDQHSTLLDVKLIIVTALRVLGIRIKLSEVESK